MQSKPASSSIVENHLFEYAVIRYIPRVEREEFINVGLIMMCKRRRWIRVRTVVDKTRIRALFPDADTEALEQQLKSFSLISSGKSDSPIALLETHERFRWLTAVRSASIATTRPHPGHTTDLETTFSRLAGELL